MDAIYGNRTDSVTRRDPSPRRSILVSAAIASIGLSGCSPDPPNQTGMRLTDLKPTAGRVTQDARGLGGSWMLLRAPTGGGIISDGTAGACLVVAMRDVAGYGRGICAVANQKACQAQSNLGKDWDVACDLPDNAVQGQVGQCWGRPINRPGLQAAANKQSCNRSLDYPPNPNPKVWMAHVENPVNQEPLNLSNTLYSGLAKPSHWRIRACVREHPGDISPTNVTICAWGPIKEIQ